MWDTINGHQKAKRTESKAESAFLRHDRRILQMLEMRRAFLRNEQADEQADNQVDIARAEKLITVLKEQIAIAQADGARKAKR